MNSRGFSTTEALLAITIFGMLVTAIIGIILYGSASVKLSGDRARAVLIAEEGLEAVRSIRDSSYTNLTTGTHGIAQVGNKWVTNGAFDTTGIYKREIVVSDVDANRKQIISRVTWKQSEQNEGKIELNARFTRWPSNITISWANAGIDSSFNMPGTEDGTEVKTSGDYAYVIRSAGLPNFFIYDLSGPADPVLTSSMSLPGEVLTAIDIKDSYAYLTNTANTQELQIVNIGDPVNPTLTGTFDLPGEPNPRSVYVANSRAYIGRDNSPLYNEFQVVDVSNPAIPTLVGGADLLLGEINEIYVIGTTAYAATTYDLEEFAIYDMSNPLLIVKRPGINFSEGHDGLALHGKGSDILLSTGPFVHSISATTPLSPTLRSSLTMSWTITGITATDNYNYAMLSTVDTSGEFRVVSLANLSSLSLSKTVDVSGNNVLNGVAYNSKYDITLGVGSSDTQELMVFRPY